MHASAVSMHLPIYVPFTESLMLREQQPRPLRCAEPFTHKGISGSDGLNEAKAADSEGAYQRITPEACPRTVHAESFAFC